MCSSPLNLPRLLSAASCQTSLTFPPGFDVEVMVGPQFLYVDTDWANSSLRRKLFGRPQHQGESIAEEQENEVCWWVTLGEVLFALKNGY